MTDCVDRLNTLAISSRDSIFKLRLGWTNLDSIYNIRGRNMAMAEINIIEKLDQEDKEKVSYFIRLLLHQSKYQALKKEIALRREEIHQGQTLTHDAIWQNIHV